MVATAAAGDHRQSDESMLRSELTRSWGVIGSYEQVVASIYETAGAAITKMTNILDEKDRTIAKCNKIISNLKRELAVFEKRLAECGNVYAQKEEKNMKPDNASLQIAQEKQCCPCQKDDSTKQQGEDDVDSDSDSDTDADSSPKTRAEWRRVATEYESEKKCDGDGVNRTDPVDDMVAKKKKKNGSQ